MNLLHLALLSWKLHPCRLLQLLGAAVSSLFRCRVRHLHPFVLQLRRPLCFVRCLILAFRLAVACVQRFPVVAPTLRSFAADPKRVEREVDAKTKHTAASSQAVRRRQEDTQNAQQDEHRRTIERIRKCRCPGSLHLWKGRVVSRGDLRAPSCTAHTPPVPTSSWSSGRLATAWRPCRSRRTKVPQPQNGARSCGSCVRKNALSLSTGVISHLST